ncbi:MULTISPECIES: hypothetical protein [unclassified Nostoc]|uniref:hypothetical protein n=1 Tax=unclassified Nostoc TaxID=2593658 RepID=UPI00260234E6|nr:hypothetical protein [Nostoc sp. S13]MDF5735627.1 hypothetical protein [Nostoc sp. S13]
MLRQAGTETFGISTKLKILNNAFFLNFKNDSDKVSPVPSPSTVTPTPSPNPLPSPDSWIKNVFIWVTLIPIIGVLYLFIKRYQNNNKLERQNHHSPIHFTIHNDNNQSKTRKDMNNNNFDQKNSNITVGNQGTNTNTNTQQFVQYTSEQKQYLSQFAKDIQRILEKLERNQPNATQAEKQNIISYEIPPEQRSRIVRALKAGGEKALEELLDNPYLNIAIAVVKEWQKEE